MLLVSPAYHVADTSPNVDSGCMKTPDEMTDQKRMIILTFVMGSFEDQ